MCSLYKTSCTNSIAFIPSAPSSMRVLSLAIPYKPLRNIELFTYARELKIPHFKDVFMRDTLPRRSTNTVECGIVNLNTSNQPGSHWVCYYRNKRDIIFFDSYGQVTPMEIQQYLKTSWEFERGSEFIQRNTDIVQAVNTSVCGHLCLFAIMIGGVCVCSHRINSTRPSITFLNGTS